MRWSLGIMLFALSCASASTTASDAGTDLSAGVCDQKDLYAACSTQCGMSICIVGSASCSPANEWVCDCSRVTPCGPDMRVSD